MPADLQRIPFPTESASLDSPSGSLERLTNYYIEKAPDQARSPVILKSTPGLTQTSSIGTGPIWEINTDLPGHMYVVSGNHLWLITLGATTDMGNIGVVSFPHSRITIATGPTQMVVCVPPAAYAASVDEIIYHRIHGTTDNPFPGVASVAYLDGYFVFTTAEDSTKFICSALFDPATTDALDFAYADAAPNVIRRVITHMGRLWFLGEAVIEIWVDTGAADFPFRRDSGGVIPYGVMSPRSACICDGSIFFLGTNGIVFRTTGYQAKRVSNHAIEQQIASYLAGTGSPQDYVSTAVAHVLDGHAMYALTLVKPNDPGVTFEYDCATERWHDRSSSTTGIGRWRANAVGLSGVYVFGDASSGALYTLDETAGADGGVTISHIATFPPVWGGTKRVFMPRLEVECDMGGNPIHLDWTDDAGATWNAGRTLSLIGKRAVATRLGSFRERTIRLTTTGKSRIHAVDA